MTTIQSLDDKWLCRMVAISLTLHLTGLLFFGRVDLFRQGTAASAPVYVDLLSLPVTAPHPGSPVVSENKQGRAVSHVVMPSPDKVSHVASSSLHKVMPTDKPSVRPEAADEDSGKEYDDRIKELELARHHNDMLENIRRQVESKKRDTGPPGGMSVGNGSQKGSDYSSFIQSRLRDAFQLTIGAQGGKPIVVVRIIITAYGGLKSSTIEKYSGDKLFETAVLQAIQLARKNFTPPPDGKEYNHVFVFRPDEISLHIK